LPATSFIAYCAKIGLCSRAVLGPLLFYSDADPLRRGKPSRTRSKILTAEAFFVDL
jgi:hypothetical protein